MYEERTARERFHENFKIALRREAQLMERRRRKPKPERGTRRYQRHTGDVVLYAIHFPSEHTLKLGSTVCTLSERRRAHSVEFSRRLGRVSQGVIIWQAAGDAADEAALQALLHKRLAPCPAFPHASRVSEWLDVGEMTAQEITELIESARAHIAAWTTEQHTNIAIMGVAA